MIINTRPSLSFGKLIVNTTGFGYSESFDASNKPKEPRNIYEKVAEKVLTQYSENQQVKNLDSQGLDVFYNVRMSDNYEDGQLEWHFVHSMALKKDNETIPNLFVMKQDDYSEENDAISKTTNKYFPEMLNSITKTVKMITGEK